MSSDDLSHFHPDTGVDRKALKVLKKRFLDLNQTRLTRTREALGERQGIFIDLLPLFFHCNHPMLPGFNGSATPAGIPGFEPSKNAISAAKNIARSFSYRKDLNTQHPTIDSLFMMGSVGTIAHSDSSDLDIWVCHKSELSSEDIYALNQKCQLISRWAERELGIEAHFFLMAPTGQAPIDLAPMTTESSGSAQYHLLLDEFYRSGIWLAGKTPLWWQVPAEQEQDYGYFAQQMLKKRFIRKQDIIDFGPITHIPATEFLGAGIWQLYKGIDSPHKSLLKLLLLESYALTQTSEPLALSFKRAVYRAPADADRLDAYMQIYLRIEQYLTDSKQPERLDIARHCFYFKVDKPLTHAPKNQTKSWQRKLLEQLTQHWQWSVTELSHLDRRRLWKAPQVQKERDRLVAELSKSYRLLGSINRDGLQQASISGRELSILGRKLHAAYERKAGKIEQVNPGISDDLSEAFLTAQKSDRSDYNLWQLYRARLNPSDSSAKASTLLKEANNLLELMVWAYRNRVLTRITQLEVREKALQLPLREHELLSTISQWLPDTHAHPQHQAFMEPAVITRQLFVINLGEMPYPELHEKGLEKLTSHADALNYSGFKDNLVKRIDVASINSWHEIIVRSFSDNPLADALLHYLRQAPPATGNKPPAIVIRCLSPQLSHIITARLEELWLDITACFYTGTRPSTTRYVFCAEQAFYILQYHQDIPTIHAANSYEELLAYLGKAQHNWSPIVIDRRTLQKDTLSTICAHLHMPGTYLFYQFSLKQIVYTLIDPEGALWQGQLDQQSNRAFLSPMLNFIRATLERLSADGFIGLDANPINADIYCYEITASKNHEYYATAHSESNVIANYLFIDITVIAEPRGDQISYHIYCDEQPFISGDEDAFTQAASYIYNRRRTEKHYHCYISDLDLTACADLIAPETGLRLIHYLQYKQMVEEELNARLLKMG
ncbi:MAG TPA: class I adenylate cyclase [Cellvibrionaceae bacterium]